MPALLTDSKKSTWDDLHETHTLVRALQAVVELYDLNSNRHPTFTLVNMIEAKLDDLCMRLSE